MLTKLEAWIEANLNDGMKLRDGEIWFRNLIKYKHSALQRLCILKDLPKLK